MLRRELPDVRVRCPLHGAHARHGERPVPHVLESHMHVHASSRDSLRPLQVPRERPHPVRLEDFDSGLISTRALPRICSSPLARGTPWRTPRPQRARARKGLGREARTCRWCRAPGLRGHAALPQAVCYWLGARHRLRDGRGLRATLRRSRPPAGRAVCSPRRLDARRGHGSGRGGMCIWALGIFTTHERHCATNVA